MPDGYERWCDTRLMMMGLDGDAQRVIEAMPAERLAAFETVKIVSYEAIYGPASDEDAQGRRARRDAERGVVYFLTIARINGRTWAMWLPFTEEFLKGAETEGAAQMLLSRAELSLANQRAKEEQQTQHD